MGFVEAKELCVFSGRVLPGMKSVWRMVLSMLRCWRILVLVKMMVGFDDAFNSLEGQVWKSEKIGCSGMVGAVSPGAADAGQFFLSHIRI
jgi:hypothetical protein